MKMLRSYRFIRFAKELHRNISGIRMESILDQVEKLRTSEGQDLTNLTEKLVKDLQALSAGK